LAFLSLSLFYCLYCKSCVSLGSYEWNGSQEPVSCFCSETAWCTVHPLDRTGQDTSLSPVSVVRQLDVPGHPLDRTLVYLLFL
jgi:hypothetical protein